MDYKFDVDDWVKLKDEEDSFHIISVANSSGFIRVEDISGHTFVIEQSSVVKKLTNEEIYGFESTTADEFNEDPPVISIFTKDNGILDGNPNKSNYSHFGDDEEDKK